MKQLIQDIIKFDQKAQQEINDLKAEKETLSVEVEKMKKELSAKDQKVLTKAIKNLEASYEKQEETVLAKLDKKYQNKEEELINEYKDKESAWLADLFDFCTKKA